MTTRDGTKHHCVRILEVCELALCHVLFYSIYSSLLPSGLTRWRFYPQRASGQALVTGVVPSPPVRAFSFCRA